MLPIAAASEALRVSAVELVEQRESSFIRIGSCIHFRFFGRAIGDCPRAITNGRNFGRVDVLSIMNTADPAESGSEVVFPGAWAPEKQMFDLPASQSALAHCFFLRP